jgi:hypothetical protein
MACECKGIDRRRSWVVMHRNCNYSAFSGYRWTPSDYSEVKCLVCGRRWRTKAAYVRQLPDEPKKMVYE